MRMQGPKSPRWVLPGLLCCVMPGDSLVGFALDCKQFDPKKEAIEHEESQKVPPVRRGQTPLQALCTVSHGLQSSDWNRGSLGKHRVRVKAGGGGGELLKAVVFVGSWFGHSSFTQTTSQMRWG